MNRYLVAVCALVLLQGCSALTPPKAKPVIEDRVSEHSRRSVGILATTPERRVVIVKMPDEQFCSEPPADAADNISSALSAVIEASAKGKVSAAEAGVAQELSTSVKQLFVRSQGVQLYRDGLFMLCNASLNGFIPQGEFLLRHETLLRVAERLIVAEIPYLHKMKPESNSEPARSRQHEGAPLKMPEEESASAALASEASSKEN